MLPLSGPSLVLGAAIRVLWRVSSLFRTIRNRVKAHVVRSRSTKGILRLGAKMSSFWFEDVRPVVWLVKPEGVERILDAAGGSVISLSGNRSTLLFQALGTLA